MNKNMFWVGYEDVRATYSQWEVFAERVAFEAVVCEDATTAEY